MGFLTKRILVVREATHGVIPTTPRCIEFLSESFGLKQDQTTEDINLLGSGGDASPMAFGTSKFSGTVGLIASADNMPMIASHILGAATTAVAATAQAWAGTTAYIVGDKVNSVANAKHTLVCVTAGTSGAAETGFVPLLNANPNLDRGARIVDGTVVWIAMPKLATYTFSRQQQIPSFTIEYELEDESDTKFYKRFSNVYMNTLPMAMSGGTISLKVSGDFMGAAYSDSTQVGFSALSAMVGATIVPNFKDYYSYEDCTVNIDTVALCGIDSINLDITRNVTVADALNNCKIVDIGITSVKGNMKRVFSVADYTAFKAHTDFATQFSFVKANGCQAVFNFPLVRPALADPELVVDKQAYLTTAISAYGTTATPSVNATITAPMLYDSIGALVGTGVY